MASSYVNNLRLNEMATGDASGTWGTVTNTNLELIGEALGFGTRAIANASTDNITIADGASDYDRAMYLKLTGGGQACTVTLLPNDVSKLWFMENGTNSALTFTQGSGANVIIPAGDTKLIASNGGGSGAIVYDVFASLSVVDLKVQDDLTVTDDVAIGGLATVGGTLGVTGKITADAGIDIDNINIDGTTIALSSGDLTVDVAGDITLDAGGADINLKDDGTQFGLFRRGSGVFVIKSTVSDEDILIRGNDGGSEIEALTFDMSEAGAATFNDKITAVGTSVFTSLDISGNIDVDGTTNLDAVDIDGTVQMGASDDDVRMTLQGNNQYRLVLKNAANASVILGSGGANNFRISNSGGATIFEINDDKDIVLPGAGAGINLGVTSATASNLLDDYEEGSWTATLVGSSANPSTTVAITGYYTKIGDVVFAACNMTNFNSTGIVGAPRITGLPFSSSPSGIMTGNVTSHTLFSFTTADKSGIAPQLNGAGLSFYLTGSNTPWAEPSSIAGTGNYLNFSVTYKT